MRLYYFPHSPLLMPFHLRVKSKVCIRANDVHHDWACHCSSSFISSSFLPTLQQPQWPPCCFFNLPRFCSEPCLSHLENFNIPLPIRSHIPGDYICFGTTRNHIHCFRLLFDIGFMEVFLVFL